MKKSENSGGGERERSRGLLETAGKCWSEFRASLWQVRRLRLGKCHGGQVYFRSRCRFVLVFIAFNFFYSLYFFTLFLSLFCIHWNHLLLYLLSHGFLVCILQPLISHLLYSMDNLCI